MYDIIIKAGTILYKGYENKPTTNIIDVPTWLSQDKEIALLYGNYIQEFIVKKDILLINLTSNEFHIDYLDKLNQLFTGNKFDDVDDRKMEAAIPLGLPSFDYQTHYLLSKNIKLENPTKWTIQHEIANSFLLNKHRYSTYERDKNLSNILYNLYGNKYKGYITNIKWPSKLHNGMFNRECCLFKPSDLIEINRSQKGGNKKHKKGGNFDNITGDSWNRMRENIWKPGEFEKLTEEIFKDSNIDNIIKF